MQHAPPPPLAPQCSMGGHDAPASPARLTVSHTSSPPAKQRSLDGRALSPPPSRLQPTGGRASVPPIHLRVSTGCAPSQPSVDARHPYWPPAPPQPTEGCASVLPPVSRQPTPISSDSPTPIRTRALGDHSDPKARMVPLYHVYINDILVASSSPQQHAVHLRQVLTVAAAQEDDPELQALLEGPTSLQLVQQQLPDSPR
ncbi:hypothetical protein E2C01_024316 [Portunus trituberculatus]|uniref:Uncharacterized protein n=1 Tax=Portunus trituberculatus TaxID=210409 RepID=A0A5B7EA05_PORTR|nr:hypothetical protein [Portunus trituberculatus]